MYHGAPRKATRHRKSFLARRGCGGAIRPATPLWAYVEQTELTGKEVVLVTTGNSRFEQVETDAFAKRVEAHGGRLIRHVFLRRGRIFWQMTRDALLEKVR